MKKLTIALALCTCMCMASCKKDWTCKCVDQSNNASYHTIPDATLTDAKRTCDGYEYQVGGVYTNCSID